MIILSYLKTTDKLMNYLKIQGGLVNWPHVWIHTIATAHACTSLHKQRPTVIYKNRFHRNAVMVCTLFIWTVGHVSLHVVNVTCTDLDLLAFILQFLYQFWISARLVCSFCEAMAGLLSVTSTVVLSRKVALVDPSEAGRSATYK
jgi:hypothetical protein